MRSIALLYFHYFPLIDFNSIILVACGMLVFLLFPFEIENILNLCSVLAQMKSDSNYLVSYYFNMGDFLKNYYLLLKCGDEVMILYIK